MSASKHITLLSDFGRREPWPAIARTLIEQQNPGARILDICHELTPFQIEEAAYVLHAASKNSPEGTVHIILYEVFYDASPVLTLTVCNGQYFLAPDNNIMQCAFGDAGAPAYKCFELGSSGHYADWIKAAAGIAALLPADNLQALWPLMRLKPHAGQNTQGERANEHLCEVLHIDNYGNAVTGMRIGDLPGLAQGRPFRIEFAQTEEISAFSVSYSDVRDGFRLCRFNDAGYLEVAINRGHAAGLFGLAPKSNLKLVME